MKNKPILRHLNFLAVSLALFFVLDLLFEHKREQASEREKWDRLESLASQGKPGKEILTIYSLFKRNLTNLSENDAWDLAQTVFQESKEKALDPMLVLAVIEIESEFRADAVSHRGARGLMQVMPIVVDHLVQTTDFKLAGEADSFHPDILHDPILNIRLGVWYLSQLREQFRDIKLALTAYNWGPTEIQKKLDENEPIPFGYATKVLAAYENYLQKHPGRKGIA